MEALFAYESQYGTSDAAADLFPQQGEIRERLAAIARFYGNLIGVKYGEPFVVKETCAWTTLPPWVYGVCRGTLGDCHLAGNSASSPLDENLVAFFWLGYAYSQEALSLHDAVALGLQKNPAMASASAGTEAAAARTGQARAGLLPNVQYSESWTRSDNPVFVFSSLLTQHQFGPQNFEVSTLNRPGFLNNFRSQVTVTQTIYDGGVVRSKVQSARLGSNGFARGPADQVRRDRWDCARVRHRFAG